MVSTMVLFMHIATLLAIASSALIWVDYFVREIKGSKSLAIDFSSVNEQIKICRTASIIFTVIAWIAASCEDKASCLASYAELGKVCEGLGRVWIIYAFVFTAAFILVLIINKDHFLVKSASTLRNTGFVMGMVFLIISFILDV